MSEWQGPFAPGLLISKKLYGYMTRHRKIRTYLHNHSLKKLQLGTSNNPISGWLNTDLLPTSREVVYLDATRPFPFDGEVFDYVFSEHVIEHLEHPSAVSMLHECFRVLKPGGRIRISTPDLRVLIGLLSVESISRVLATMKIYEVSNRMVA